MGQGPADQGGEHNRRNAVQVRLPGPRRLRQLDPRGIRKRPAADDVDVDRAARLDHAVHHRAPEKLAPAGPERLARDDLGHVVPAGVVDQGLGHRRAGKCVHVGAQPFGEGQVAHRLFLHLQAGPRHGVSRCRGPSSRPSTRRPAAWRCARVAHSGASRRPPGGARPPATARVSNGCACRRACPCPPAGRHASSRSLAAPSGCLGGRSARPPEPPDRARTPCPRRDVGEARPAGGRRARFVRALVDHGIRAPSRGRARR